MSRHAIASVRDVSSGAALRDVRIERAQKFDQLFLTAPLALGPVVVLLR